MRVTLRKRKEEYVKEPKCKACGSGIHCVDKERKDYIKRTTCNCDGIHHPHRKGCKWCNYYTGEYEEEELRERNCI